MPYAGDMVIDVLEHNGTMLNGQPTYSVDSDWEIFGNLAQIMVEYYTTGGRERVRGQQVEATSSAVMWIPKGHTNARKMTSKHRIRLLRSYFARYDRNLKSRTFEIVAFGEDKSFMKVECIELTDEIENRT